MSNEATNTAERPRRAFITIGAARLTWEQLNKLYAMAYANYEMARQTLDVEINRLDGFSRRFYEGPTVDDFQRGDIVTWGKRQDRFVVLSGKPQPFPVNTVLKAIGIAKGWRKADVEGFVIITNGTHYYRTRPVYLTKVGSLIADENQAQATTCACDSTQRPVIGRLASRESNLANEAGSEARPLHAAYRV